VASETPEHRVTAVASFNPELGVALRLLEALPCLERRDRTRSQRYKRCRTGADIIHGLAEDQFLMGRDPLEILGKFSGALGGISQMSKETP